MPPHRLTHDFQVSCLHECQMAIMRAYEVASMHVSKTCYINMYRNIDEPFRFNASLRHTLVTLVLIANTFSTFISLSFLYYFLLILFLHCKLVFGYCPDTYLLVNLFILPSSTSLISSSFLPPSSSSY